MTQGNQDRETLLVQEILASKDFALLDFDGPICSVFAGYPAPVVADQLRQVLTEGDHDALPPNILLSTDPFDVYRHAGTLGDQEARHLESALRALEVDAIQSAEPTEGAHELMRRWRESGRKIAIVSNNSTAAIEIYLTRYELTNLVDVVCGRSSADPKDLKPSPHLILKAIEALKEKPENGFLIGDSTSDMESAVNAGVTGIGYANKEGKADSLMSAGASAVFTEIPKLATQINIPTSEVSSDSPGDPGSELIPKKTTDREISINHSLNRQMQSIVSNFVAYKPFFGLQEQLVQISRNFDFVNTGIAKQLQEFSTAHLREYNGLMDGFLRNSFTQQRWVLDSASLAMAENFRSLNDSISDSLFRSYSSPVLGIASQMEEINKAHFANIANMVRAVQIIESPAAWIYSDSLKPIADKLASQVASGATFTEGNFVTEHLDVALQGWNIGVSSAIADPAPPTPERLEHLGEIAYGLSSGSAVLVSNKAVVAKIEPWQEARAKGTDPLVDWLESLDPKLARKFKGMWNAVGHAGPDWLSQSANSAIELIDWTLRTLAPDSDVIEWQSSQRAYADEIGENGRPHRSLRVRYIGQTVRLDATATSYAIKSLNGVMKKLQGIKHADKAEYEDVIGHCLVSIEHFLIMIRP